MRREDPCKSRRPPSSPRNRSKLKRCRSKATRIDESRMIPTDPVVDPDIGGSRERYPKGLHPARDTPLAIGVKTQSGHPQRGAPASLAQFARRAVPTSKERPVRPWHERARQHHPDAEQPSSIVSIASFIPSSLPWFSRLRHPNRIREAVVDTIATRYTADGEIASAPRQLLGARLWHRWLATSINSELHLAAKYDRRLWPLGGFAGR